MLQRTTLRQAVGLIAEKIADMTVPAGTIGLFPKSDRLWWTKTSAGVASPLLPAGYAPTMPRYNGMVVPSVLGDSLGTANSPDDSYGGAQSPTVGTIYLARIGCLAGTINGVSLFRVNGSIAGITAAYSALYDVSGNRLACSTNTSPGVLSSYTPGTSVGCENRLPFTAGYSISVPTILYAAWLLMGSGPPGHFRNMAPAVCQNLGLTAHPYRAISLASQSSMPTTITWTSTTQEARCFQTGLYGV